ncbi:hypothetical protein TYRP_006160 [Tyrophagus putrescentiae]|nr:hypothetical protein TYRP_006160 [Tyrophagus putrescentiae]
MLYLSSSFLTSNEDDDFSGSSRIFALINIFGIVFGDMTSSSSEAIFFQDIPTANRANINNITLSVKMSFEPQLALTSPQLGQM